MSAKKEANAIGWYIEDYRRSNGMSRKDLARAVGVETREIVDLEESEGYQPTFALVARINYVLGINLN